MQVLHAWVHNWHQPNISRLPWQTDPATPFYSCILLLAPSCSTSQIPFIDPARNSAKVNSFHWARNAQHFTCYKREGSNTMRVGGEGQDITDFAPILQSSLTSSRNYPQSHLLVWMSMATILPYHSALKKIHTQNLRKKDQCVYSQLCTSKRHENGIFLISFLQQRILI